jgi:serine/threonine protein kinase/Tfp pilus assembly protein PilF
MKPSFPISTCPMCGSALEETSADGFGCMVCLLRVGIGGEEERGIGISADHGEPGALESNARFGVYEIERRPDGSLYELGRGAMGVTYRAIDTTLQRKVALKVIKIDVAGRSADARERFMREARAAAALWHENIATVFQFGISEETGQYFYAMELIEGETLDERVRRTGPLDVGTALDIGQQITAALTAAEKRGLIHRDLKPANLMLVASDSETPGTSTQGGDYNQNEKLVVKIIDFGLAKALNAPVDPMSLTRGGFVGTPEFASPEQFSPKAFRAALDVRSDIYSLGVTLWFALTGKTPFASRSVKEIHRPQQSDALPIEQLKAAHVPHRLRLLLESMLAFEPAARPGTHDLAARLRRCTVQTTAARRNRLALAAAFMLIIGVSAFSISRSLRSPSATAGSDSNAAVPEKSIAVLPFNNLSAEKENAYFADGVQEEILTDLTKIADLKVISRVSVMQYRSGVVRNLREIGQQLGIANVVEGSVQRSGNRVRINAKLVDARTDRQIWGETYDRDLADVFAIQSEIAKGIAESLQAKLTGGEKQTLSAKPTNNPEAYDAYLRGLAFEARSGYSNDLLTKAIDSYEQAVHLDPDFALAWARLSRADALLYFRLDKTAARRDGAKSALENAQKLQPELHETLLALGYYQYWVLRDYGLAKTTFERVSKTLPGSSEVPYALGLVSRREGHWDESVAYLEQALALDPRNAEILDDAAGTYALLRQFPTALGLYDRALDILPNDSDFIAVKAEIYQAQGNLQEAAKLLMDVNPGTPSRPLFTIKTTQLSLERNFGEAIRLEQARLTQFQFDSDIDKVGLQLALAIVQRLAGDAIGAKVTAEQARKALESFQEKRPDNPNILLMLSLANAAFGEKDTALKDAERAIMLLPSSKDPVEGPPLEANLAIIHALTGENTRAISILTRLLQTPCAGYLYFRTPITPALLRLDPIWDPLRADPAFQKLCEEK